MTSLDTRTEVLASAATELLCALDEAGRIAACSGPWPGASGRSGSGPDGRPLEELVTSSTPDAVTRYVACVRAGIMHNPVDVWFRDRPERVYSLVVRRGEEVVASLTEVTAQRRAEQSRDEANARVERQTEELRRVIHLATHELSEPLRAITSYCALLVNNARGMDDDGRDYLAFVAEGAVRMRTLVDDLGTLARVFSTAPEQRRVALDQVFDEALRVLRPAVTAAKALVHRDPLPEVTGDADLLVELARNLLDNAVKFATPGRPPRITVTSFTAPGRVGVTVADNGIGVDPVHRTRVFEPFKRLHGRGTYDGSGLGLALCKRIAEAHDGRIDITTSQSGGCAVTVSLPAAFADGAR